MLLGKIRLIGALKDGAVRAFNNVAVLGAHRHREVAFKRNGNFAVPSLGRNDMRHRASVDEQKRGICFPLPPQILRREQRTGDQHGGDGDERRYGAAKVLFARVALGSG